MIATNEEVLRKGTIEQQAKLLCDIFLTDGNITCDSCPAKESCRKGHTGFTDWLKKETWFNYY